MGRCGDGAKTPIEGLSDGTRDQLYLALRMAALEHNQQEQEPFDEIERWCLPEDFLTTPSGLTLLLVGHSIKLGSILTCPPLFTPTQRIQLRLILSVKKTRVSFLFFEYCCYC